MSNKLPIIVLTTLISILVVINSARAQHIFKTTGVISYLTLYGNGGPRSGETIVESANAAAGKCGYQFQFTGRVGYPLTDSTLGAYVRMNAVLLNSYVRQMPVIILYFYGPNLPEIVGVHRKRSK